MEKVLEIKREQCLQWAQRISGDEWSSYGCPTMRCDVMYAVMDVFHVNKCCVHCQISGSSLFHRQTPHVFIWH